jgi:hypothetical protein
MTDIHMREIVVKPYQYKQCQVVTDWLDNPPRYIHCVDPDSGREFIAQQRMGAWMECDVSMLLLELNNKRPKGNEHG